MRLSIVKNIIFCFLIVLLCLSTLALSSETDPYTLRFANLPDATPAMDLKMNQAIQNAIEKTNKAKRIDKNHPAPACSTKILERKLGNELRGFAYSPIENFINRSDSVPKARTPLKDSVYGDIHWTQNIPAHLGLMGFGSVLRINGVFVGSDKLGHFTTEGYAYYKRMKKPGTPLKHALQYGIDTENGIFGIKTTGVKSYADTVANFNGMNFWAQLTGQPITGQGSPYVECRQGNWVQVRPFTWTDYVDGTWDEAINCNTYRSAKYERIVNQRISEIEKRFGKSLQCPVEPETCANAKKKYGESAPVILHERCLNAL